ncbi:hypothetical protein V496_06754 [Pseudogymnoascus sp. VKM F-4515 (FW-2607)]|nr:hypothetical protein V496_06754 [Pseudogymnoascus sp. VKM F-4515 (FW-2607)]
MIDATFKDPTTDEFFAFSGSQFVRFAFADSRRGDKITNSGPVSINTNWKSLTKAGFSTVDAVLPVPRVKSDLYVFSSRQYIRIRVKSGDDLEDELIFGPHKILDTWKCLAQAGFDTFNAVMPVPDTEAEAILDGPHAIAEKWPGLVRAGFDSIDTILPSPHGNGQTYFFKGMKYARIKVIAGEPDVVEFGPANIMDKWAYFDWVKTTKPTDSNSIVRFTEPAEVDPALEVLLGKLEKLSSSALTAQAGIDKNPDDNEKYRADLVAAKKAEGEIEEQIKEQFPDLYAKYHKGSGHPQNLQLFSGRYYITLRVQNHTKYNLGWDWKSLWGTDCFWDTCYDETVFAYDSSDMIVQFGIFGAPEGKVRFWILDGSNAYFELHFWQRYLQEWVRGSCDVYNTGNFYTTSNTWSDGWTKEWREFHIYSYR